MSIFLQRATAGFRRTTLELTDGNHDNNHPSTSSTATHSEDLVTMEMNSSPPVTDPVRDDSCSSNNHNLEGLYCSEIHVEEDKAAKEDEDDHHILKTEEETYQDEGDGRRELINEKDEGGWVVRGEEELDEPENGDKEELRTGKLGKVEGEKEKVDEWVTEMLGETKQDSSSDFLLNNENPNYLLFHQPAVTSDPPEAALQESWRWEDSGKTEDFSNDHLNDFLQAKLAVVYPESDAEEDQWAALSCEDTSNIEESEMMTDSTYDTEEGIFSVEVEARVEEQGEEEVKGEDREDDEEQMKSGRDLDLQSPFISSMTSSVDSDRRVSFTLIIIWFLSSEACGIIQNTEPCFYCSTGPKQNTTN